MPAPLKRAVWRGARGPLVALRSLAVLLIAWKLLTLWIDNPILLPSPERVATAFRLLLANGEILAQSLASMTRLAVSIITAFCLGASLGLVMGINRTAGELLDPVVEMLRPISGIAWIPLGLFIFGVGNALPIFIMFYGAFFSVVLNTVAGVRATDRRLIDAARTMGVSRAAIVRHVIVPAALPNILIGLRLAVASGWTAVVAAELVGATDGVGYAIEWYRELLMTPKVLAFIVTSGLLGYMTDLLLRAIVRRATPWADGLGTRQ